MSLYNALFGVNEKSPILMSMLGIDSVPMPDAPDILKTTHEGESYFDYGTLVYENESSETDNAWEEFRDKLIEARYFPSGRFRDIYLNEDGTRIILYTRNGGGNRPYYQYVFDLLRRHPQYVSDYDDDYDCTYAYIKFKVPDQYKELCASIATGEKPETIHDKFQKVIEGLKVR